MLNAEKLSSKVLVTLISKIGKNQVKLRDDIQSACLKCIKHAILYGDVSFGTRLMDATKGSIRRQAIVNYLSEFGPFSWNTKDLKFSGNKKWDRTKKEDVDAWIEKVNGTTWYDFTTEPTPKPYDFMSDLKSLLGRVKRHTDKGENVGYGELRDAVESAFNDYAEKQKKLSDTELKALEAEQSKEINSDQAIMERQIRVA